MKNGPIDFDVEHTIWNVFRGCSKISEGCLHCCGEMQAGRLSQPRQAYANLTIRT